MRNLVQALKQYNYLKINKLYSNQVINYVLEITPVKLGKSLRSS